MKRVLVALMFALTAISVVSAQTEEPIPPGKCRFIFYAYYMFGGMKLIPHRVQLTIDDVKTVEFVMEDNYAVVDLEPGRHSFKAEYMLIKASSSRDGLSMYLSEGKTAYLRFLMASTVALQVSTDSSKAKEYAARKALYIKLPEDL